MVKAWIWHEVSPGTQCKKRGGKGEKEKLRKRKKSEKEQRERKRITREWLAGVKSAAAAASVGRRRRAPKQLPGHQAHIDRS